MQANTPDSEHGTRSQHTLSSHAHGTRSSISTARALVLTLTFCFCRAGLQGAVAKTYPSDEPGKRASSSASNRQPSVPSADGRSCSDANLFIPSCYAL